MVKLTDMGILISIRKYLWEKIILLFSSWVIRTIDMIWDTNCM